MKRSAVCIAGKLYGNYLITAYLAVKLLYLANAVGQLFLLDAFLKIDYHLYGIRTVERLIRGQDWGYSERFPRVTLCEFEIRHQSRVHQYVVQCALTINLRDPPPHCLGASDLLNYSVIVTSAVL